jgi:hypothetical protein
VTALAALVLGLQLVLGVAGAGAHQWNGWHWNQGGTYVPIYFWDSTGGCGTGGRATNDALYDIYWNPHPIYTYCVGYHTQISILQSYQPGAWWCGLAEVWGFYTSITGQLHTDHAHATWNTACTSGSGLSGKFYQQGIFCQEIAHAIGLDHSNTADCMGLSYFIGSTGRYYFGNTGAYAYDWDHQSSDLYWIYRYHSPHG